MNTWAGTHMGVPCTVGLRPEHILPVSLEEPGAVRGRITAVEHTGRESIVYLEAEGLPDLIMAADASFSGRPGEAAGLFLDQGRFHYFDVESGARI